MAQTQKEIRTVGMVISVICFTSIQLTLGLALPPFKVPSNALPGYKITNLNNIGQLSEIASDSKVHDLFQLAEDGAVKIKDSIEHLANSDVALKVKHMLGDRSWEDLLHLYVEKSSPIFNQNSYRGSVYEGREVNQRVEGFDNLHISLTDHVSYQLAGNGSKNFKLDIDDDGTVAVLTTVPLDRALTPQFHLEVVALNEESQETRADLIIDVMARNSHAPAFVTNGFVSSTYAGAPPGTRVVTVHATDDDVGESGAVTYTMEPQSDTYILDPNTGVISVSAPPAAKDYTFTVMARDHGNPPLSSLPATVTIIVRPLSANFRPYGDDIMYAFDEGARVSRVRREALPDVTYGLTEAADVGSVVYSVSMNSSDLRYQMGNPSTDVFSIDEVSGNVTLLKELDYETTTEQILNVEITSITDPDAPADTLKVIFQIEDADDPPVWTMEVSPYIAVVPLDAPNKACVYTLTASDPDPGSVVTYFLLAGGNGWFSVDETSGCINTVVTDETNYENDTEYVLSVYAVGTRDTFVGEVSGTVSVFGGSHPPQFTQDPYQAAVLEDQADNQQVIQVEARSFSRNVGVSYSIVGPENRPTGSINSNDGTITLTQRVMRVDYLPTSEYFLIVRATETSGDEPLSADVRVVVTVEDINNCAPTFEHEILYIPDVSETAGIGETIGTVTATDCDVGANAELTYSITTSSIFTINSATGEISPVEALDFEKGPQTHVFNVRAEDGGSPSMFGTATVVIWVVDTNEAPVFNPSEYAFRMDETAEVQYEVGTVYVTDDDIGDTITYTIIDGDGTFSIDDNGVIKLAQDTTESRYQFQILARDSAGLEANATAVITVTDLNDNIPSFPNCTLYAPNVEENTAFETPVIQVVAVDDDQGSNADISYDISSNNEINIKQYFKIDDFGLITTTTNLDREVTPSFEVTVLAEDAGQPALTGFCTFTIIVTDVNDNPPLFSQAEYRASVSSNAEIGTPVLTVTAEDPDANATITYKSEGTIDFSVNPLTGVISVRGPLTATMTESNFVVKADDGQSEVEVDVQIDVRDPNDDTYRVPVFQNTPYIVNISEGTVSDDVLTVSAVDGDDQVGFNILQGLRLETNSALTFALQGNLATSSADLVVQKELDYETVQSYSLTIIAKSTSPYEADIVAVVNIVDVNDEKPIFPDSSFYANILENMPPQTPVIRIQATDRDFSSDFRQVQYRIRNVQNDFSINSDTGEIVSERLFDREDENTDQIVIEVIATDGVDNSSVVLVYITIVDENDNVPTFDGDASFIIPEDAGIGFEVGNVTATDDDISQNLEYFISSGNVGGAFTVDTKEGIIYVASVIDYETEPSYTLGYSVNDGKSTSFTTVTVTITNVNDVPPLFTEDSYAADLTEEDDTNLPRVLLTVEAVDDEDDSSNQVLYELFGLGVGEVFEIDPGTGNISVLTSVDREEVSEYALVAKATDENGAGISSYAEVVVTVEDINDNEPTFPAPEYVGSVQENQMSGTFVMFVTAEDPDLDALTYRIVGDAGPFAIDAGSGEVTTTEVLDRESQDEYTIVVEVSDGVATAQTEAIISVDDADDVRPVFINTPYPDAAVSESEPIGSVVTVVYVEDPDVGFREEVEFYIDGSSDDGSSKFEVVRDTATLGGLVKIKEALDFEEQTPNPLRLVIGVEDSQGQIPKILTDFYVLVEDANEIVPVFDESSYAGNVREDAAPGTAVVDSNDAPLQLQATETPTEAGSISYAIDPASDPSDQFSIDDDGYLTTSGNLDRETSASYELVVWAIDGGDPPQTGAVTVEVDILDVDDTAPRLSDGENPTVDENQVTEVLVTTVTAVDDDDPPSGPPFIFNVQSGDWEDFFVIPGLGSQTDRIEISTTGVPIDRETHPYFDVVFEIAEVNTVNELTGTSTLTIEVRDENDNPHEAATKSTTVYSYEGNIPTTQVGRVEVDDPDILDDKEYTIPPGEEFPQYFELDDNGYIIMLEGTPPGIYTMKVIVSDNKYPDVISTVVVDVRDIPREAVYSSGSIRISGTTAEALITPGTNGKTPLETLREILADAVGAELQNLDIFTVLDVEGGVDIRYSAHGSPYYPADQLDLAALGIIDEIEAAVGGTVEQIPVDLCVDENVCESSCTNVLHVNATPTVVDSGSASFVAVTSFIVAECVCGARTTEPGTCESAPCLNGGECVDVYGGTYQCKCPYGFDGPNCQQTKRSFKDGYASFSPLRQCEETTLSIEFITEVQSGTLLYNGPIMPTEGDEPIDMILLELVGGRARLTINLGSEESGDENLVLTVDGVNTVDLGDGEWHRIDIYRNGRSVEMTVDRCQNAVVAESSSSTTADYSVCRDSGETPGPNKFLNVKTPLFLGGISSAYDVPRISVPGGFDGCIRNLKSDGFLYDLATSGQFENSESGCPRTDNQCLDDAGQPRCNNGTCEADLDSFICICYPGHAGTFCTDVLEPYDFGMDSYVNYVLTDESLYDDGRTSNYQIMVRTREPNGLVWSISNTNTYEYINMQVIDGNLKVGWHLGDAPVSVTMDGFILSNGAWHVIHFDRYDNVITVTIDGGGGVKEVENRESTFFELAVDPSTLVIGATVDLNMITDDYMGCMNDPRINNNYLGLEGSNEYAEASPSPGVTQGCVSDVCDSGPCTGSLICIDHWRLYECSCPEGTTPAGGDQCSEIIDCEPNPCRNGGTCKELDPTGFECSCQAGYYGETCAIGGQGGTLGLSTLGTILIIICILLIILLLVGLMLYTYQRERKSALAFAVDPEDDIRENFINYDEEGGGEEDNDAYDLNALRKPVDTISAGSLEKKPIVPEEEHPRFRAARPLGDDPNVGDFINDRLKGADGDPDGPPFDEYHIYDEEGNGSTAGSLSSLNSSSTESEQNYDFLNDWGPQFRKLADMYGS